MSEEYRESFEVSDRDLDHAMGRSSFQRRKMTKDEQTYGIWGDSESEEETRVKSKKKPSYTAPMAFVSGGIVQSGKKKEEPEVKNEEEDSDEEIEAKPKPVKKPEPGAARRVGKAGQKNSVADWQVHTKGIGTKLMLKMGFQPGKGIGKKLQGIAKPVEAVLRKGRGAIGAYGAEIPVAPEPVLQEQEEAKSHQWRAEGKKKSKVNYVYKSVEQVIQEESKGGRKYVKTQAQSKVKVIDMTGPEQRVLSGYHAISSQAATVDLSREFAHFDVPELRHNVTLFLEMCEHEIIRNARELNHAHDRIVGLEQEESMLEALVEREKNSVVSMQELLTVLDTLAEKFVDTESPLTLDHLASAFIKLQSEFYEEFYMYDLGSLAEVYVVPLLRERLSLWQPLSKPTEHIGLFRQWKDILEGNMRPGQINPYYNVIWNAWMPLFRIASSSWNCRNCIPMIELIEIWLPYLPPAVLENILHHFMLPKIQSEVEGWNPLTDTVPIHTWIKPWIPILGRSLDEIVYPTIRQKLGFALINWHPSDKSARLVLEPWVSIFPKPQTDAFLIKHIVPKLGVALNELVINPQAQILDQWNWVVAWEDLLPPVQMVSLLNKFFFPKWLQVLATWLNHNPNYEEVTSWYRGWKGLFPENLAKHPSIKEQFTKALDIMNRAVQLANESPAQRMPSVPYMPFPTPPAPLLATPVPPPPPRTPPKPYARVEMSMPSGFRDLVIRHCEEKGILMIPVERWQEGKQVYKCGNTFMYFDKNVIFVKDYESRWIPTSLQSLLDVAQS